MRNLTRKIVSIICIFALLVTGTCVAFAGQDECKCGKSPVIMISGFGATTLAMNGEAVFPPTGDTLKALLKKYGFDISKGLAEFITTKNINNMGNSLIAMVNEIIEPIRMNKDGSSCYDIEPIVSGAKNTSLAAFKAAEKTDYIPYTGNDFLDMQMLGDKIGDDHVFNFTFDWRMSNSVVADQLLDYIEDVRELTGHNKVSVYCISQGSLLMGEYLYKYAEKGYIDHIVFDTPLLGGTDLVSDIFNTGDINLNFAEVLNLLGCILHTEFDLSSLSDLLTGDTIHLIVNVGAQNVIKPVTIFAAAFWEMLPPSKFTYFKNELLDADSAPMIEQISSVHNGFMSHISETLHKAEDYGATVYIKTCSDIPLASGSYVNSDGVVNTQYSCGAYTADWGQTLADDYEQADKSKAYSLSPAHNLDLSCGYYPEHTWIVSGLYHGQVEWDRNSINLVMKLLFTDEIKDAYSSYEFPQFLVDYSPTADVALTFDCTNTLFLATQSGTPLCNTITVKNTSEKNGILIDDIVTQKGSVSFGNAFPLYLAKGESVSILFTLQDSVDSFDTFTVQYVNANALHKPLTKQFGFTVTDNYAGITATESKGYSVNRTFITAVLHSVYTVLTWFANIIKK